MRRNTLEKVVEQGTPYVASIICGLLWHRYFADKPVPAKMPELIETIMSAYSVGIGFLTTALALLFAIDSRNVIQYLKENYLYKRLIRYFFEAIVCSGIALLYSCLIVVHRYDPDCTSTKRLVTIWVFLGALSAFLCARVVWVLFITLHRQVSEEEKAKNL